MTGYAAETVLCDENVDLIIEINEVIISEAYNKSGAIIIEPEDGVNVVVNCSIIGDETVYMDFLEITILFADVDTFSSIHELEFDLYPGENASFFSSWTFSNNMSVGDFDLIGGIFEVRYDLHYTVNDISNALIGRPFFLQISDNPLLTGTGLITSLGVALAGISTIKTVKSMSDSIPREVNSSLESSIISSTNKLKSTYEGKFTSSIQNEISHSAFTYIKSKGFDKCPKCDVKWPERQERCPSCNISYIEAEALCAERLGDKSLSTCKELVDSTSVLSVHSIATKLGQGVVPTTSIISVLVGSGLAIAKPRLGKSWSIKTRKLFFKALQTAIFSIFWVQAIGMDVISLTSMGIVILTGTIPALIISRIVEYMIRTKTKLAFKLKS